MPVVGETPAPPAVLTMDLPCPCGSGLDTSWRFWQFRRPETDPCPRCSPEAPDA